TAYVEAQLLLEKLAEERTLLYEGLGLLTGVHTALIGLYVNSGRPEQAQKVLLKSIEALQKLDGAYPQVPYFSSWLAASQVRLADWYAQMGKLVEAEEACRKGEKLLEKAALTSLSFPVERFQLAVTLRDLGTVYSRMGRMLQAESIFQRVRGILEAMLAEQ